ncbi:MAG: TIR domain-containing protein, partial [Planctomycetota bacterium]
MKDPKIFLSYASRDLEQAVAIERNLVANGLSVFRDRTGIKPGSKWTQELERGLRESTHLCVLISPASMASGWVQDEVNSKIAEAQKTGERLFAIELFPTPISDFLSSYQTIGLDQGGRDAILTIKRSLCGTSQQLVDEFDEVPRPKRYGDPELRQRIVEFVGGFLERPAMRIAFAHALGLSDQTNKFRSLGPDGAASLGIELAQKDDAFRATVEFVLRQLETEEIVESPSDQKLLQELLKELDERSSSEEERPLIERYLDWVRRRHGRITPFGRKTGVGLDDGVWIQLRVRERGGEFSTSKRRVGVEDEVDQPVLGQTDLGDLLRRDRADESSIVRRVRLFGDPGSGKTTLLRNLAARIAGDSDRPFVPVFAALPTLVRERRSIEQEIEHDLSVDGSYEGLGSQLTRLGQSGELLVLLDGLDEVPSSEQRHARQIIDRLCEKWPNASFVVASRRIGSEKVNIVALDFADADLLPVPEDRKIEFLTAWLKASPVFAEPSGGRSLQSAIDQGTALIRGNSFLKRATDCPLYLTLLALLVERDEDASQLHRRDLLHATIFQLLLSGGHREEPREELRRMPRANETKRVLNCLGFAATKRGLVDLPSGDLEEWLSKESEDLWSGLSDEPAWETDKRRFLTEIARRTSILGPKDSVVADGERSSSRVFDLIDEDSWRFWHKSFGEALAADRLDELPESARVELLDQVAAEPGRWGEPFALWLLRVEDDSAFERWMQQLHERSPNLALRVLSGVSGRVLDADLLALLLGSRDADGERRIDAYPRILEFVDGDVEVAVRVLGLLVDRLLDQDWDAEEAWHLDDAFSKLILSPEHCSPVLVDSVQLERDRILGHSALGARPVGAEVSSMSVPTREGESWWCPIGVGNRRDQLSYRMGSPEGEEGRFEDEGPAHDVVI